MNIARANGLPEGLDAPRATLIYNYGHRRLIWNVSNLVFDRSRPDSPASDHGDRGGDAYLLDAVTGKLLAKQEWMVIH